MESTFGKKLKVTVSGGSHEPSLFVTVSGLPREFQPDMDQLRAFLERRSPGKSPLTSSRREPDIPVLLSDSCNDPGSLRVMKFEIANTDCRPRDYEAFRTVPRPGHADYTGLLRYGKTFSGGGPFSGRMTAPLCLAGGLAIQVLASIGVSVAAELVSAGGSTDWEKSIADAASEGDSAGGIVSCTVTGYPAGVGDAMYGGLESLLSPILFGIPAVKGVEFGAGFRSAALKGSENNDAFYCISRDNKRTSDSRSEIPVLGTRTNNCGGILGGISTGMPVTCRVAFKPTPTISIPQESVDLSTGEPVTLTASGRHDPCVALRAVPVVEAAMALGLLDALYITENAKAAGDLDAMRSEIDETDREILGLLKRRMDISAGIGRYKKQHGIPVQDAGREDAILENAAAEAGPDFAPYAKDIFRTLFSASKALQRKITDHRVFGLIGHPLGHSFSREVHEAFGEYSYSLFDMDEAEMKRFLESRNFHGLSVTRPYKQAVIPFCDRLTESAKAIGAVNTVYRDGDKLVGHNTDLDGFLYTADRSGIDFAEKTILILGTGGTSKTVNRAVELRGARQIFFASRTGRGYGYDDLNSIAADIDIIVNTTPAGMYPEKITRLICLKDFTACEAVIDVIYNPARTGLIMDGEALGLKTANGLPMIVAQAAAAAERFLNRPGDFTDMIEPVLDGLQRRTENIVFIGMPGCGKTTLASKLAAATDRTFADSDREIVRETGRSIPEIINSEGEDYFRDLETAVLHRLGAGHGQVIATGGGAVLRQENYESLRQNGTFIWLTRPNEMLSTDGRPLSESTEAIARMYDERAPLYKKWADCTVDSDALYSLLK